MECFGVDVSELEETIKIAEDAIKLDVSYLLVSDNDFHFWPNGQIKRLWHLKEAQANAISNFKHELEAKTKVKWEEFENNLKYLPYQDRLPQSITTETPK
jgi:hypothetical protein